MSFQLIICLVLMLVGPIFVVGIINRTKAIWAGRKGLPLNQFYFELRRLLRKVPVYSEVSNWLFQLAPWAVLGSVLLAGLLTPWVPGYAPLSFACDFVVMAYLLAFGRVFLILGAMDTGSSFEGMGASREATYSALAEPVFFLVLGTLALASGHTSFQELWLGLPTGPWGILFRAGLFVSLFILLQVEGARVPVDDPTTHLELTMIHEVMILDHSGPELAALQYGAALKLTLLGALLSALLNPFNAQEAPLAAFAAGIAALAAVAVLIGLVESLIARFRLKALPRYISAGLLSAVFSLLVLWVSWEVGA